MLPNVDINVMLDTGSSSVSSSIAYIVVVAAVGITEIIMRTTATTGSISTTYTNKNAITGATIIFSVTADVTTCHLSFTPLWIQVACPAWIIITGIAALPTIDNMEWMASGTGSEKYFKV